MIDVRAWRRAAGVAVLGGSLAIVLVTVPPAVRMEPRLAVAATPSPTTSPTDGFESPSPSDLVFSPVVTASPTPSPSPSPSPSKLPTPTTALTTPTVVPLGGAAAGDPAPISPQPAGAQRGQLLQGSFPWLLVLGLLFLLGAAFSFYRAVEAGRRR